MKYITLSCLLIISLHASGQEDYTLYLNDTAIQVSLDKKYEVLVNGRKTLLFISANDTLLYDDKYISFQYPKDFKVSKTQVEDGVEQLLLMTAEGTGVLIQKYSTINPSNLNELMLHEVTKESIVYGFTIQREDYDKRLRSGLMIKVIRAVLTYKDETNIFEITSMGKKDEGVLIMTMKMDNNSNSRGQHLLDLMWKSLTFK